MEWEVATIYCLQGHGEIRAAPAGDHVGEIDLVYRSRATQEEVAIEITAVSDRALHERNPVEQFTTELTRIVRKRQLHQLGGFHTHFGHVVAPTGAAAAPILGVPEQKDFLAFFKSAEFEQFVARIRSQPLLPHRFEFVARGASSVIEFKPGTQTGGGGGHIVYTELHDPVKNPIVTRLRNKDEQIRRANLDLPSLVILCDAHCRALHTTMPGIGKPTVEQVIRLFLNGQEGVQLGPWKIQAEHRPKSRRINAVAVWSLHEDWMSQRRGPASRSAKGQLVLNESETLHPLSVELASEVTQAFRHLPPIVKIPLNAHRVSKWPYHYRGASRADGGKHRLKAQFSLLTLQKLLTGKIFYEEFARAYPEFLSAIQRCDEGLGRLARMSPGLLVIGPV
jgi:hypothetical protein